MFAAHAIVSPQGSRDPAFYLRQNIPNPSCRVVREEDDGVVITGMKMLATNAALADEIWIGNILPLAPEAKAESVTFAVPCNTKGVSFWSRRPIAPGASSEIDAPEEWPTPGYVTFNRRMMYAALNWGVENYSAVIDTVRELCGGGALQMPADTSFMQDETMAGDFKIYWQTPHMSALDRMKLF